ncbi:MAG TPA: hypothetical protein VFH71_06755 [Rhodanobacteraceae bacterium]|nr:hypothetical protein [Rhodanobacteraceae bacterium]
MLQERGGDFACGFGPKVCRDARHALHALAGVIRKHGAAPILLGTYQGLPDASTEIVRKESAAARDAHVEYISVSDHLQSGLSRFPREHWFWKDKMHPGHELVLLDAVLMYRQVFGTLPAVHSLRVHAAMFVPSTKFFAPEPVSRAIPNGEYIGYTYTPTSVRHVVQLARISD